MRLTLGLLLFASAVSASAFGPEGDAIIKKIEAVKRPAWDQAKYEDKAFMAQYMKEMAASTKARNALILQLFKVDPKHPKTAEYMRMRWTEFESGNIGDGNAYSKRLADDVDRILATHPDKEIVEIGEAVKISTAIDSHWDWAGSLPAIEKYLAIYPKSTEGSRLILMALGNLPPTRHPKLHALFLANYPDHKLAPMMRGAQRQVSELGKPFELKFTEAITGQPFDIASLRGKVVVLDFWATWCGPCVAKMPELRKTFESHKAEGLEVIGISLDQPENEGGLKALKEFVAKNGTPWPQYYQGNGWDSDFSKNWGIMRIPNVFVIDRKGNLRKVDVNDVEATVKELLAEKA